MSKFSSSSKPIDVNEFKKLSELVERIMKKHKANLMKIIEDFKNFLSIFEVDEIMELIPNIAEEIEGYISDLLYNEFIKIEFITVEDELEDELENKLSDDLSDEIEEFIISKKNRIYH